MMRFTAFGLLGLVYCVQGQGVTPTPTLARYSNVTSPTSSGILSPTTDSCCFVVLDTVIENWWQEVSTSTYYSVVNLTSITTLVTPYPTITSTNYETNVYTTNATFHYDYDVGWNPITLYTNDSPGPKETDTMLNLNATLASTFNTVGGIDHSLTAVTTAGTVIQSPQAYWAYSTVRIITAEAVTDSSGNKACVTASGFDSIFPVVSYSTIGYSNSDTYEPIEASSTVGTTTYTGEPFFTGINSNVASYFAPNQTSLQTGVVISLTTPFIYAPTRGATLVTGLPRLCDQRSGEENYGYPVQTLLDYLVQNPVYSSQYPGLEKCLPGGPNIVALHNCSQASPEYEVPAGDLTSSTVITVTPTDVSAQPVSTRSPTIASPTQESRTSTGSLVSQTSALEKTSTRIPEKSSPQTTNPLFSLTSPGTSPDAPEASSQPKSPASIPPASSSSAAAAALASAIASGIGATSITNLPTPMSGTTEINTSGSTTAPLTVNIPPHSGSTTIVNGVTSVVTSSASLPGSTTLVSGTLDVVLGTGSAPLTTVPLNPNVPGLKGSTIVQVSAGQSLTFVVVSAPETVPVVSTLPTGSVVAGNGSSTPLQYTSGAERVGRGWLSVMLCCVFASGLAGSLLSPAV